VVQVKLGLPDIEAAEIDVGAGELSIRSVNSAIVTPFGSGHVTEVGVVACHRQLCVQCAVEDHVAQPMLSRLLKPCCCCCVDIAMGTTIAAAHILTFLLHLQALRADVKLRLPPRHRVVLEWGANLYSCEVRDCSWLVFVLSLHLCSRSAAVERTRCVDCC
jgi:hypothetical protein